MVVRKLAEKFRSHGVHYSLVARQGDVALFSLRYGDNTPIIGYDVVKVCHTTLESLNRLYGHSRHGLSGELTDTVELYPKSSLWGSAAWSFDSLPAARQRYFQLIEQEKQKALEQVSGWRSRKEPSYRI